MIDPKSFHSLASTRIAVDFSMEIVETPWVSACGNARDASLSGRYVGTGLQETIQRDQSLLMMRNAAANDMRAYLWQHHSALYRLWNSAVEVVMPHITPATSALKRACSTHGLGERCFIAMRADIIDYGIWVYYSTLPNLPTTPCRPMAYYRKGRIVCGWGGDVQEWPNVEFLYY